MSTVMNNSTDQQQAAPAAVPVAVAPERSVSVRVRRLSRRSLIVSLLCVLVGAAVTYWGVTTLTRHSQVLAVARDIPAGTMVSDADLVVVSVTQDPAVSSVPAGQRSSVVGQVAQSKLFRGTLVTRSMVGSGTGLAAGRSLVALALKDGAFPARGLTAGQKVLLVPTPVAKSGASVSDASPHAPYAAEIADVGSANASTGVTVIDVSVATADAPAVAQLGSAGAVTVVLVSEQ